MAAANQPKRRRVVTTRPSSDYCRTCRVRRVRCDGQRPQCRRCLASGRECGGYTTWEIAFVGGNRTPSPVNGKPSSNSGTAAGRNYVPGAAQVRHALQESIQHSTSLEAIARPVSAFTSFRIGDGGQHAFEFFRQRGIDILVYGSPNPNVTSRWTQLALCVSYQEPALLYAIAAIGSKMLTLTPALDESLKRPENSANSGVAMQHYHKALTILQERIHDSHTPGTIESIVLSCCIFLMFEVLRGRALHAIRHHTVARNVIGNHLENSCTDSPGVEMMNFLSRMFDFSPTKAIPPIAAETKLPPAINPREHFSTLDEAGAYLEAILEVANEVQSELFKMAEHAMIGTRAGRYILDSARSFCLMKCLSRAVWIHERNELQGRWEETMCHLISWKSAFAKLVNLEQSTVKSAFMHHIRCFTAYIALATCTYSRAQFLDQFTDEFALTLRLIERFLQLGNGTSTKPQALQQRNQPRGTGMVEHGLIPALFVICCKCRVSEIRRRAAQVLFDANRIEAPFASRTISVFAESIINLEEERGRKLLSRDILDTSLPNIFNHGELPEAARFADVVISGELGEGKVFRIIIARFAFERAGELELLEYRSGHVAEQLPFVSAKSWTRQPVSSSSLRGAMQSISPIYLFEAQNFERLGDWTADNRCEFS